MAKDVVIRGVVYADCPEVTIPINNSNDDAHFYDASAATLNNAAQLLDGVKGMGPDGTLYTGNIPSKSASDLTVSGDTVTVPAGNYASNATKSVAAGSVTAPATISGSSAGVSTGSNTLVLTKTVSVTPNVTAAGYISSGTPGDVNVSLTASVTTKSAATITPGTSSQEIAAGTYCTGKQTISGDANLVAPNIVAGKSIFGVAGSAQIPIISQDAVTKVLSIS